MGRRGHRAHPPRELYGNRKAAVIWVVEKSSPVSFIFAEKAKEGLKKHPGAGQAIALFKDLEIMFGVQNTPWLHQALL